MVIIHDKMDVSHLSSEIWDLCGNITEVQEVTIEGFEQNTADLTDPISAFQLLVSSTFCGAKRITQIEKPFRAEVYLPKG